MPTKSTITDGIIYTEISGEISYNTVIQQIDFISSLKEKITNRFELIDHTNITNINISSDEIVSIAAYSKKMIDFFPVSFAAIYVPNDVTFGMVRMFETWYQLQEHSINVSIFRNKAEAIRFLTDKKNEHEQQQQLSPISNQ